MRRPSAGDLIAVVIVAIGLAAVVFVVGRQPQAYVDTYSTHDSDSGGYLAWYRLLAREGLPVERFEHPAAALDASIGTLIVSNNNQFSLSDVEPLERFVRRGGSLVWISGGVDETETAWKPLMFPVFRKDEAPATADRATPVAPSVATRGVTRIDGDGRRRLMYLSRAGTVGILADGFGGVAVRYAIGAGRVTVVSDPSIFTNRKLAAADNARFAVALATQRGARTIAFDEAIHGFSSERSVWDVLPGPLRAATIALAVLTVLALIGAGLRVLPLAGAPPVREPDAAAYLTAVAALLRRGRAATLAARNLARAAFATSARSLGLAETAGERMIFEAYRQRGEASAAESVREIGRLCARPSLTDAELVAVAQRCFRLRKDG